MKKKLITLVRVSLGSANFWTNSEFIVLYEMASEVYHMTKLCILGNTNFNFVFFKVTSVSQP